MARHDTVIHAAEGSDLSVLLVKQGQQFCSQVALLLIAYAPASCQEPRCSQMPSNGTQLQTAKNNAYPWPGRKRQ